MGELTPFGPPREFRYSETNMSKLCFKISPPLYNTNFGGDPRNQKSLPQVLRCQTPNTELPRTKRKPHGKEAHCKIVPNRDPKKQTIGAPISQMHWGPTKIWDASGPAGAPCPATKRFASRTSERPVPGCRRGRRNPGAPGCSASGSLRSNRASGLVQKGSRSFCWSRP